jgi:hypothetical protein
MLDFALGFDNDVDVALIAGNYKCSTRRTKYSAPKTRTGSRLLKSVDATAVSAASYSQMLSGGISPSTKPLSIAFVYLLRQSSSAFCSCLD